MAGAVAAPNPERARTKSDEGVMSWLTGNAPGEPHDDKENEATPSRTRASGAAASAAKAWNVPLATILPNIEGKKRGLGRRYQEVFETLEPEAMAAASIAQVHRATLRRPRGQQVLVKVQHVGVRDALRADVAILPYLIQFVDNLDPNHGLRPLMYMISSMLEQEVDFRIEARASGSRPSSSAAAERAEPLLDALLPLVMWDYCVESMMVQEFMEGALKRNLKSMFKDPKMVARLEQAFTFHQQTRSKVDKAIAETADVRFELIIIDHGFHTHVTYEYRLAWCKVWAGIGLCDEELLKEGCADFGLEGDDYKKMTMILSFFPYPVWRERRFCRLSEFLGYLKSGNEHGLVATQEVTNRKLPKQFHLMHRTSQQIAAHFNANTAGYEARTTSSST
ncbi:hypothetical protein JL720_15976 [Aureococcus anophagefferens]|nr:hypothetical protein JL720_15976 [Aureococcus anophagefferens]